MSKLFEEVNLGGLVLKNRMVVAPMGTVHAADGGISPQQHDYLVERAKGGFGLIYPSAHTILDKYETPNSAGNHLTSMAHMSRLAKLVEEVHRYGAKFAVQLTPGYGRVNMGPPGVTTHVSASEVPVFLYPDQKCKALTLEEIKEFIQAAKWSAKLAKDAGVDVIEIHAYGGYLLDQFISKCWNHREDEYGGTLENRLRFTMEIKDAIKEAVGDSFPVSIKATPQHGFPGGRTLEDEGIELFKILDKSGFAYLHVDVGAYECWNKAIPSEYEKPGCQLFAAERLRREGIKTPFLVQGKLNDPVLAEETVSSGTADIIALGHQSLADPYWPRKVHAGRFQEINYCICCNECLNGKQICAVNPRTYHEAEYTLTPPAVQRKLLVVGGGPGGMYTAALAAKQGHKVTLWEKSNKLGGLLNAAGAPDFKIDMSRYNDHLIADLYANQVDVRLCWEATPENIDAFAPDAVIIAAGAMDAVPPVPGIHGDNVIFAYDLLANKAPTGKQVVVMGGGIVGCEAALYLDEMGKQVTIVEMLGKLLSSDSSAMNSQMGIREMLNKSGITIRTNTRVKEIRPDRVLASSPDGDAEIPCDNVILAAGFRVNHDLQESLKDKPYRVFAIGNYNHHGKVYQAIHDGFHVVRLLDDLMEI